MPANLNNQNNQSSRLRISAWLKNSIQTLWGSDAIFYCDGYLCMPVMWILLTIKPGLPWCSLALFSFVY